MAAQHAQKYHIIDGPSCMLVNSLYSKILFLKMYLFINRIRRFKYLRNLQSLVGQPFLTPHFEGMQSHIGGDFSKLPFMISPLPAYSCQIGRSFSATKKDASELRTLLGKCNGLKSFFFKNCSLVLCNNLFMTDYSQYIKYTKEESARVQFVKQKIAKMSKICRLSGSLQNSIQACLMRTN